ncbi:MAG: ADP-ribosylglycohydrolase family protein [Sphingomonadales bacterium]|nr:ADP-ribosylglycohydrolase family protein [Sphingomonadales bacterium]
MRTSQSHPLEIAEIDAGPDMGKIGLTFCPGKQQMQAATGAWNRDLGLDVAAIARWNAAAVVTLVEQHELDILGVAALGDVVRDAHMAWYHLPIRDVAVPDASFEESWTAAGSELRAILQSGFNVLVHCKGGLGRAGTVAARLLVELGWEPQAAIAAVRAVRPGAIETAEQQDHVLGLGPVAEPAVDGSAAGQLDRALGAMLGLAVGDALGTTLEFAPRDSKSRLTDMTGAGPFHLAPGEWTDDTAMALALMDSLIAHPMLDERDLMDRFVSWHQQGTYSCTGRCFDIGITTRAALSRYKCTGDPMAGSTDPMCAGNGSLMRLAPVVVRHCQDRATLRNVAARQSRTTHAASEAVDACIAMAEILAQAMSGTPRSEILRPRSGAFEPAIASILAGSWRGKPRDAIHSSGYVAHSFEAALWCVGRTGTFTDAVLLAANLGEDADTTAAITGQLAGALYGASGIFQTWKDQLAWGERITRTSLALFEQSVVQSAKSKRKRT